MHQTLELNRSSLTVSLRAGPTKSSSSCSVHSGASLGKVNAPEPKLATAGPNEEPTCCFQDKCCLSAKNKVNIYTYIYIYNQWCSTLHDKFMDSVEIVHWKQNQTLEKNVWSPWQCNSRAFKCKQTQQICPRVQHMQCELKSWHRATVEY